MKVFCTDLDHTLIYSHRQNLPEPRVLAETLGGKPQSYMTKRTYDLLKSLPFDLIPVSTRSPEQFLRIHVFFDDIPYRMALLCGGAVKLVNGKPDPVWNTESERIAGQSLHMLSEIYRKMRARYGTEHLHFIEPFLVYLVPADAAEEEVYLRGICPESLAVHRDHRKLYVYPAALSKGTALRRLRADYGYDRIFAAGDSVTDLPMLREADLACAPDALRGHFAADAPVIYQKGAWFCDTVCDAAAQFLREDA